MDDAGTSEQGGAELPDVSPDVSVFWKPLHLWLQDGKPVGPVTVLFYDLGGGKRLPFAAIAKTRRNRLILWPPWGALARCEFSDGDDFPVHHVTLALNSGETHLTRFHATGRRMHKNTKWKLAESSDGLRLWLVAAFQVALLEKQVGTAELLVRMPPTDSKRRQAEFRRYAAHMTRVAVRTPPLRGDCFVTAIHLLPDSGSFRGPITSEHFPMGGFLDDWVAGWPDRDKFQAASIFINVGGVSLLLLTASPLGRLRESCFLAGVHSYSAVT